MYWEKEGEWKGVKREWECEKGTHDHSDVLSSAWLNAACRLRCARLGPVSIVYVILQRG